MDEVQDPQQCIFCHIVAKRAPAHVVHEDERTLVFMDIFPVADGHVLVIPKAHGENLLAVDDADLEAVVRVSRRVARALREVLEPDGIGVFQLNGAAAGQTVFHYHMHLIPRMQGAPLQIHSRTPGESARLAALAGQLAKALRDGA